MTRARIAVLTLCAALAGGASTAPASSHREAPLFAGSRGKRTDPGVREATASAAPAPAAPRAPVASAPAPATEVLIALGMYPVLMPPVLALWPGWLHAR